MSGRWLSCALLSGMLLLGATAAAAPPPAQVAALAADEARALYLANQARRRQGLGPLRANRQLAAAARSFAHDSVEHRLEAYCGHTDTGGAGPADRAWAWGYRGRAGVENVFCGYVAPAQAVEGWLGSADHRANLLDTSLREAGMGYYQRAADGRGYVALMFGEDPEYVPVVINDEAPNTDHSLVNLYIYSQRDSGVFASPGPASAMRIANEPCFTDAAWQPYASELPWDLAGGGGWRSVYVQTRDAMGRTATAHDTIFAGPAEPAEQLGREQMSDTADRVTLYNLAGGEFDQVQFSPGWIVDNTYATFEPLAGLGARVDDPAALGGSAFRLDPGEPSTAWVWTTEFVKDVPLVAYVRLKVDDISSADVVGSFTINGGGTIYGPVTLRGSDFAAPGQYQEFALPFTFNSTPASVFLIFNFARLGSTALFVDAVAIYSAAQPLQGASAEWLFPGGNYRGQGVQVRYTNAAGQFSAPAEAHTSPYGIQASPAALTLLAQRSGGEPVRASAQLKRSCIGDAALTAHSDAAWLSAIVDGGQLMITADPTNLAPGSHEGTVAIEAVNQPTVAPASVRVTFKTAEQLNVAFVPLAR